MAYMNGNQLMSRLGAEISKVIKGKQEAVQLILTALLAQGHVLIEDVPGVGKTTLAMALGRATGLAFRRAQFTPDVMASDITGFTMFDREENRFEYRAGLVMTNILLADEINRTSPKTQSALLEAMEEKRVTVDGVVHSLPSPFMVIATQNSQGYVGTFPLPEAQLDRFMIRISMGYPSVEEETGILLDRLSANPVEEVQQIMTAEQLQGCIDEVQQVQVADSVCRYIAGAFRGDEGTRRRGTRRESPGVAGNTPGGEGVRVPQRQGLCSAGGYSPPDDPGVQPQDSPAAGDEAPPPGRHDGAPGRGVLGNSSGKARNLRGRR